MGRSGILVARRLPRRLLGVSVAVSAMVSPLAFVMPAQAMSGYDNPVVVASAPAPQTVLLPSPAIAAETVNVAGTLPGVYSRPVWVQRRSGASWVSLVKATTSRTGSYATSFKAPAVGAYALRSLAPKMTIAGKVRAQYVSPTKSFTVVAQAASLSMSPTLTQATTSKARLIFRPVRVGRPVVLQVLNAGVWTTVAAGQQSSIGGASLPVTAGAPGTYSYRALTAGTTAARAFASPTRTLTVTASLTGAVTSVQATPNSTSIALSWTNPIQASLTGVMIRRAEGSVPPASATSGEKVADAVASQTSFTDMALTPGMPYSYALFAHNGTPVHAAAATITVWTTASGSGNVSGTVVDAGGAHHGLANVSVRVQGAFAVFATTGADGSYTVTGLAAGTYSVCFGAMSAAGGSSDALGYVNQCYNNQAPPGTPNPVTVTTGLTTTGIDAAMVQKGAISGTLTDVAGSQSDVSRFVVTVTSPSTGAWAGAIAEADGSYVTQSMPPGSDYRVCIQAFGAAKFVDQCYDNQPTEGTATPVVVTPGATTTGINAALTALGKISGTVTDTGGTHQGLANVDVMISSASTGALGGAITAADGTYTADNLPSAADYQVCFFASGYVHQCYDNQPIPGTPTPVTVIDGVTTTAINAAMTAATPVGYGAARTVTMPFIVGISAW